MLLNRSNKYCRYLFLIQVLFLLVAIYEFRKQKNFEELEFLKAEKLSNFLRQHGEVLSNFLQDDGSPESPRVWQLDQDNPEIQAKIDQNLQNIWEIEQSKNFEHQMDFNPTGSSSNNSTKILLISEYKFGPNYGCKWSKSGT